jgi:hypothetical protein
MHTLTNPDLVEQLPRRRNFLTSIKSMFSSWRIALKKVRSQRTITDAHTLSPHIQRDIGLDRTGLPQRYR